jgi:hypothetical protein
MTLIGKLVLFLTVLLGGFATQVLPASAAPATSYPNVYAYWGPLKDAPQETVGAAFSIDRNGTYSQCTTCGSFTDGSFMLVLHKPRAETFVRGFVVYELPDGSLCTFPWNGGEVPIFRTAPGVNSSTRVLSLYFVVGYLNKP